eukprot:357516-Chlamydomonas_euryale.AAC.9
MPACDAHLSVPPSRACPGRADAAAPEYERDPNQRRDSGWFGSDAGKPPSRSQQHLPARPQRAHSGRTMQPKPQASAVSGIRIRSPLLGDEVRGADGSSSGNGGARGERDARPARTDTFEALHAVLSEGLRDGAPIRECRLLPLAVACGAVRGAARWRAHS